MTKNLPQTKFRCPECEEIWSIASRKISYEFRPICYTCGTGMEVIDQKQGGIKMQPDIAHIIDDLRLAKKVKPDGDEIGDDILSTLETVQSIHDGIAEAVDSLEHLQLSDENDRRRLIDRATSEVVEQISRNVTEG